MAYLLYFLSSLLRPGMANQLALNQAAGTMVLSSRWAVLGPFEIGTREAAWGSDPLEYYGGFTHLEPSAETFPSSLSSNASAAWISVEANSLQASETSASVSLAVSYPDVDWTFLQTAYGWASTQFQGWARGSLTMTGDENVTVLLQADRVIELAIDKTRHFGGDMFAFRKAPLVLRLSPGKHTIDVRLVRDVRAMGGIGIPSIDVGLKFTLTSGLIEIHDDSTLVPDLVNGQFCSQYGRISVTNTGPAQVAVFGLQSNSSNFKLMLLEHQVDVAPGQTRHVAFEVPKGVINVTTTEVVVLYHIGVEDLEAKSLPIQISFQRRAAVEPHKFTYLHPGGIISYSMLRVPSKNATCSAGRDNAPVLLQLHGAGLEADNGIVAHALDPLPDLCAWALFPTGVTPWSGDDWHNWGFADVEAAISALPRYIEANGWKGVGVDTKLWFVSGHSNGGQGTWYALTHRPDKVFAAAPVSGYLSIHTYVPYQLWHPMDPRRKCVIESAATSYRHELLAANIKGIPVHQQHGSLDDNVPTYHSRLMHQMIAEAGWSSNYTELPGMGHWFDTVMTTDGMVDFYKDQLKDPKPISAEHIDEFELVVANPGDTESKFGILVVYLQDQGQLGRLHVSIDHGNGVWRIDPKNILVFEVTSTSYARAVSIKGASPVQIQDTSNGGKSLRFHLEKDGTWSHGQNIQDLSPRVRQTRQLGGLDAILRSNGSFTISHHGNKTFFLALQISRNLHQYFYADSIIQDGVPSKGSQGNVITIAVGSDLPQPSFPEFPIQVDRTVKIRDSAGFVYRYGGKLGNDVGVIFLRPLTAERLELVIWGESLRAAEMAARLVPMMTGTGQPDFVVVSREMRWKGASGAAAMGFFDTWWNVTQSSVLE